ncbi:hypothetical protein [Methanococcus maripaludis]|uniref:Uncharacterized protein n=1 Tax=Methanococcus maripaludis TaxID=39152 RepID=A0A8T3VYE9_METMI|nr:hypothetical protein [Methanococcus maripaludis]MBG0769676.1 hypothetical protein [Methanococcus maripaludis]
MFTGIGGTLQNYVTLTPEDLEGYFIYVPVDSESLVSEYLTKKNHDFISGPSVYAEFTEFVLRTINLKDWIILKKDLAINQMPTSCTNVRMGLTPTVMNVTAISEMSKIYGLEGTTYAPLKSFNQSLKVHIASDDVLGGKLDSLISLMSANNSKLDTMTSKLNTIIDKNARIYRGVIYGTKNNSKR